MRVPTSPKLDVLIEIGCPAWSAEIAELDVCVARALSAALETAATHVEVPDSAEVSVLLTDDDRQRALNAHYRGKDASTNVLSFPAFDPDDPLPPAGEAVPLGDISVAYGTTAKEAISQDLSFTAHFTHLLVHGLLHLLGYDHECVEEAEEMEALEVEILAGLGVADPYAGGME